MNKQRENLAEQMSIYIDCMKEARMRLERAGDLSVDCQRKGVVTELDLEFIALQVRKVIELIALASIAANKPEYEKIRVEFEKDWNARLIFKDVERINPNFFPIPFEFASETKMAEPSYECIDKEGVLDLYSQTCGFLHSRNRYSTEPNYGEKLDEISHKITLLQNLLRSFEVHLLPESYLYFVVMNFREEDPVQIALAGYI